MFLWQLLAPTEYQERVKSRGGNRQIHEDLCLPIFSPKNGIKFLSFFLLNLGKKCFYLMFLKLFIVYYCSVNRLLLTDNQTQTKPMYDNS